MNRIDRQNLSALANSVDTASPIGLNTTTGVPDLGASAFRPAATLDDDATVANSGTTVQPKPNCKFALPEDFGTVPVGMDHHGDYTGPGLAPRPGSSEQSSAQNDQIIAPKPGSKFATPAEEDEFGAIPAPLTSVQSEDENAQPPWEDLQTEEQPSGQREVLSSHPQPLPPEIPRPAASVPDDMSLPNSGEVIAPKPGSKFAA